MVFFESRAVKRGTPWAIPPPLPLMYMKKREEVCSVCGPTYKCLSYFLFQTIKFGGGEKFTKRKFRPSQIF
jgi:hypothetical protein